MFKFDAVVGNPPYHYETGRRKIPIYQHFLMSANKIAKVGMFITPDGFIKGGQQLEPLRDWMVTTRHLVKAEFHKDSLFNGVAVDAAITFFDYAKSIPNPRKIVINEKGQVAYDGVLDYKYRDVEVDERKYQILSIFERIISNEQSNMSDIIPGRAPFGLNTKCWRENQDKFMTGPDQTHYVKVLVNEGDHDFYYINPLDIFDYNGSDGKIDHVKLGNAEKWKMVFPKAGLVKNKALSTQILKPGEIFTDKYLCIFANNENEALNEQKYFISRFYRAGLDSKMTSWILYRNWHANIPIQDFTDSSDIDWSKSISEIDQQLYRKYGLTDEEIGLIEDYIK